MKIFSNVSSFRMNTAKDDEVIRTRLLLDGEGAGDDRKLTLLLKSFLRVRLVKVPFDVPRTFKT